MTKNENVKKERRTIRRSPEYKKAMSEAFKLVAKEAEKTR
ncbi:hypothetical protein MOMOMM089B2_13145 [Morganella morganii]